MAYLNHRDGHNTNRVRKNEPSNNKDVQYLKSINSGNGKKGIWDSVTASIKLPEYNLDNISKEKISDWIKNNKITNDAITVLNWFNKTYNRQWF